MTKVGYECGYIFRIFIENEINWGYFFDHNPYMPHCNAHPNNFVVINDENNEQLLAPVDFDMAFFKSEFINIDKESANYL